MRTILVIAVIAWMGGCSKGGTTPAGIAADYEGPIRSTDVQTGADVYATFCEGCHPGGAKGDGPKITGLGSTAALLRKQIREGEGKMPGFGPRKINDDELEAVLAYLVTLGTVGDSPHL